MEDEMTGEYGTAVQIPRENWPDKTAQLSAWVITAPCWHIFWSQYMIAVVSLAEFPGIDPPVIDFPGATHELMVIALNPDHGPYDARNVTPENPVVYMLPHNICEQFTTTDKRAIELCELFAGAVIDGRMCPETIEDPVYVRSVWRQTISVTLDHFKDPHHGLLN